MEVEDDNEEKEKEAQTGDEGTGASDSDEPQRARRNRPTGLRYRIRRKAADGTASPGVPGYDWIQKEIGKIMGTRGM
eukprot:jgi/Tetstr1/462607/TSEL_007592.t1